MGQAQVEGARAGAEEPERLLSFLELNTLTSPQTQESTERQEGPSRHGPTHWTHQLGYGTRLPACSPGQTSPS